MGPLLFFITIKLSLEPGLIKGYTSLSITLGVQGQTDLLIETLHSATSDRYSYV